jgi:hypothetical protein
MAGRATAGARHRDRVHARCDVAPVDLADPAQALRLKAFVWPEMTERFQRLEAAIDAARAAPPDLVKMNAADFVEAELARPQAAGTTRVLMHSIVWQYVPGDQQERVTAAMEAAGARASADKALAWIALEANREIHLHELVVRYWPGDGAAHAGAGASARHLDRLARLNRLAKAGDRVQPCANRLLQPP